MSTVAILPIKSFDDSKQRLSEELAPGPRRALVEAMFSDVLVALRRSATLEQMLVVTSDHVAQQIAGGYGALVVDDLEEGHSEAAGRGIRRALASWRGKGPLGPGRLPDAGPAELDELLGRRHRAPARSMIVPTATGPGPTRCSSGPPTPSRPHSGPVAVNVICPAPARAGQLSRPPSSRPWGLTSTRPTTWPRSGQRSRTPTEARRTRAGCSDSCRAAASRRDGAGDRDGAPWLPEFRRRRRSGSAPGRRDGIRSRPRVQPMCR